MQVESIRVGRQQQHLARFAVELGDVAHVLPIDVLRAVLVEPPLDIPAGPTTARMLWRVHASIPVLQAVLLNEEGKRSGIGIRGQ